MLDCFVHICSVPFISRVPDKGLYFHNFTFQFKLFDNFWFVYNVITLEFLQLQQFIFAMNTILNDIAATHSPILRDRILESQAKSLEIIIEKIYELQKFLMKDGEDKDAEAIAIASTSSAIPVKGDISQKGIFLWVNCSLVVPSTFISPINF